jgi:serine/threonine-protein kinase
MNRDQEGIRKLFEEAVRRSGAEREEYIASLSDDKVTDELRSLLAAHEDRGPFDELLERVSGPHVERLLHLEPGDVLGPYRIVREIASGGMAIVYEAEDRKHEREVAVKVLRPELAALLGADRFIREMKTTAKLQHPHILPLFDSGESDGLLYYVMPYVEGETLRDRLDRETQLGVEEAVGITTEVAEALDYAHKHDVIHRDIKPGNILLQEGRPLVSDFGIALALSTAAGERTTEAGVPLGTPHYMSPEQAVADKDLTHRSDIYSLGCVLYEMLAGEPPYTGTSVGQIIRSIVTDEARPVTELRKTVPPNVAAALAKSLEKLPADRFGSVGAFGEALADPNYTTPTTRVQELARSKKRWHRLAVVLAVAVVVAILAGMWGWLRSVTRPVDRPVVEFTLDPPDPTMVFGANLVLSPDGRRLVAEVDCEEGWVLYQRPLDEREWRIIPNTEGAYAPFFSPDGEWLGFFSHEEGVLKRVQLTGGSVQTIAWVGSFEQGAGASWGPDNTVVFSTEVGQGLFRVPVDGGEPEQLTTLDTELGEIFHSQPHHLPGGDVILFRINRGVEQSVAALSLESGQLAELTQGVRPHSIQDGRVAYARTDGYVFAQAFDPRTMALGGPPTRIAEQVKISQRVVASYTVSSEGSLAYLSAKGGQLFTVSRNGEARPLFSLGGGSRLHVPRYSPSGDRIAFVRVEGDGQNGEVWVYSLAEGTARRLSFEGPATDPAWTNDGRSIGYSAAGENGGSYGLYVRAADGTGPAEQVLAGDDHLWQMDFAPGDHEVIFFQTDNLFRASLVSDSGPVPLVETGSFVTDPALSPDGRWLAYKSSETGIFEVYVRSYPDMGPPTVVSIGGGEYPAWSADGSEVFYWSRGRMIAASVSYDGSRVSVDSRVGLFNTGDFETSSVRPYAVHPNGEAFVMAGDTETRVVWRVNALAPEE